MTRTLALVSALALATAPVLGAPPSYWLDLRGYDPPRAARELRQPLLILQGERDYQVTMNEFQAWKEALAGRPAAAFRSYPKLDHLFRAGQGKSTPADYEKPGHVAAEVIADVAALVRSLGFRREGLSPKYLKIGGRWQDHECWAILAEEWRIDREGGELGMKRNGARRPSW